MTSQKQNDHFRWGIRVKIKDIHQRSSNVSRSRCNYIVRIPHHIPRSKPVLQNLESFFLEHCCVGFGRIFYIRIGVLWLCLMAFW
ncbi:unnamed protein product [Clavelina lepadiformis]|uniref:Uncharacterized protein n=1 Tax=Clavelina lepadiformis TaxID=159417 RepID=A0ABP0G0W4_CLALP